ncbi:uncharacterized protein LOC110895063 [Helianthus annuus]|uniref:uncharacterized protein LOC110895063 n=1 Tax=Helianthus annuus TaxID=4232 RepID=UPI000B8F7B0F|nr:uncharacterized protein LOC110895063 [Helianthus annuus]
MALEHLRGMMSGVLWRRWAIFCLLERSRMRGSDWMPVADLRSNGVWIWPEAWRDLYPVLIQLDQVNIDPNKSDRIVWRDGDHVSDISASCVWSSIRYAEPEIDWCSIVWFPQCIPRHAFFMWLIMRVWHMVRQKVGMDLVQPIWGDVVDWLSVRARSKSAANLVARILVAASAYVIWQERNARLFKNQLRPPETISVTIIQMVRYKLMGVKLKNTASVQRLLGEWEIHKLHRDVDGG